MTQPAPGDGDEQAPPPASADRTRQVARPPCPGRAVRAEIAAGDRATPPVRPDDPTVTLSGPAPGGPHRTLQYGDPGFVRVTVGPRARPRRRYRTWPWILAVVLALVVLGGVLVVMLLRGATIDGDVDLDGSGRHPAPATASIAAGPAA